MQPSVDIQRKPKDADFFDVQTDSSRIKANIVAEYFPQYCRILLKQPQREIRYLDLFSGPGRYRDGNHSTPLLLAKACAEDQNLAQKVRLIFNDNCYANELELNFYNEFPRGSFAIEPRFGNRTVGEDPKIEKFLTKSHVPNNPFPTLLFFDPFGYKGIDSLVLSKFLANWGNEIFLFVNIKRIHAAIENDKFDSLMKSLFPTTVDQLRKKRRYTASVHERLQLIMNNLASEFENSISGKLYSCAFKFQEEDSTATSHFVLHLTKHHKGYELVKQIYYNYDNIGAVLEKDGVYTFDSKRMGSSVDADINFGDDNVKALSYSLMEDYRGKTITAKRLFDSHHPNTQFCGSHYAKTLREMVDDGRVEAEFNDDKKHKVSVLLTNNCILNFKQ